ncbi:hypothetical protein L9F63_020678, partial [Diploptera punctata]
CTSKREDIKNRKKLNFAPFPIFYESCQFLFKSGEEESCVTLVCLLVTHYCHVSFNVGSNHNHSGLSQSY